MSTYSKSLVILTLFAVFLSGNKAHHCGSPHEKVHKKFEKGKTSRTAPTSTTTKLIKVNPKCNTGTVPSCKCGDRLDNLYPVPKSGKCADVFNKHLSKTPTDYHFREENCHKAQRPVCVIDSTCYVLPYNQLPGTPPPTPDEFIFSQNASKPFCTCGFDNDAKKNPMPKSGNCTERYGLSCYKAQAFCRDTCYCNRLYVDPTKCDPQKCNNASKPFCKCGIDGDAKHPMPKSGNCMDVHKHFKTTPIYYYRYGVPCYTARNVCKCTWWPETHCECNDECVSGCES